MTAPTPEELMDGNLDYLREKYAIGFITLYELEIGVANVLRGGAVNVPQREMHALRGCRTCLRLSDRMLTA